MLIECIISGGQTGADRAGLDAAIACSIPHGGWCPRGRRSEDGTIPECYQLQETASAGYLVRTERNVKESDGTVIFTMSPLSDGSKRTAEFAAEHRKPWLHLLIDQSRVAHAAVELRWFTRASRIRTLNVVGTGGSKEPELYGPATAVVRAVLRQSALTGASSNLRDLWRDLATTFENKRCAHFCACNPNSVKLRRRRWAVAGIVASAVLLLPLAALYAMPDSLLNQWLLERKIVGKWGIEGEAEPTLEFLPDRTALMKGPSAKIAGKWEAISGDSVKIVSTILGAESVLTYDEISFSGEAMSVTLVGNASTLVRMP